ncbi:MAG TPA: hypothetical protein VIV27_07235, partial [Halioglobus sp.]
EDDQDKAVLQLLQECKRLQEYLGIWHDTVVHLRMVREFAAGLDPGSESALIAVLKDWCLHMEGEAQENLDKTRARLEGRESLLLL